MEEQNRKNHTEKDGINNKESSSFLFPENSQFVERDSHYFQSLKQHLIDYNWLYCAENVKFFIYNLWEKVPLEWKTILLNLSDQELQQLPSGYQKAEWPESLKTFLTNSLKLQLPRKLNIFNEIRDEEGTLGKEFLMKMGPKKVHEVNRLGRFVNLVGKAFNLETLVDVGAGEGYVSHFVAQKFGFKVVAVESNISIADMGEQRASAVNKLLIHRAKKNDQEFTPIEPIFVKYTVHEGNVRTFENEILGKDNTQIPEYLLIGLHTCGNLAIMNMDIFLNSRAKGLISVGCCYHTSIDNGKMGGFYDFAKAFPLSTKFKTFNPNLNWSAMKIATTAAYQYMATSVDDPTFSTLTLAYRAVAEVMLLPRMKGKLYRVKTIHNKHHANPPTYFNQLLQRFCIKENGNWIPYSLTEGLQCTAQDLHQEYATLFNQIEPQFQCLKVWVALQTVFAGVIETALLLDRKYYLEDHEEVHATILPIFNPEKSPRNMAIVAVKKKKDHLLKVVRQYESLTQL